MEAYQKLEKELAKWIGCNENQVVVCSSGTAALHLALECLNVPIAKFSATSDRRNDLYNVICPNYTMIACPLAISLSGMIPALAGCKSDDLLIDPICIDDIISKRTVAIMCAHIYGRLCDMESIIDIAQKYDIPVIEDMAEVHGCIPHPNTDIACWSFYKNKIVHGEEGGCIYFKNEKKAEQARLLRNMGFTLKHDYTHIPRGHNYRMSNLHAKAISKTLPDVKYEIERRNRLIEVYDNHLMNLYREECIMKERQSPWVYDICVIGINAQQQDELISELVENKINARHGFKTIGSQEQFKNCPRNYSSSGMIRHEEIILLPLGEEVNEQTIIRSLDIVDRKLRNFAKRS